MSEQPWVGPIRRLMAAKGWNQTQLAEHAQVQQNTMSNTMNGRGPRMDTMKRIAAALDVPLWALFVSEEQSALLTQSEQTKQQLVKQEDLAAIVIKQLAPAIASAIANAVQGVTAPTSQPTTNAPASDTGAARSEDDLARGHLPRKRHAG